MKTHPIPILFLYPGFDMWHPVTGGEKYASVMIQSAQADHRLDVHVAPYAGGLPNILRRNAFLRRAWLQCLCLITALLTPCSVLVVDSSHHSLVLAAILVLRWFKRHVRLVVMHYHLRYLTSRRRPGLALRIEQAAERRLYLSAHHLIAISQDGQDKLCQIGIPPQRISVIRPAIDPVAPGLRQDRDLSKDDSVSRLLFVGQCYPRKGIEFLIMAMAQIKNAPIHLDLVGKYDPQSAYVQKLQHIIAEHDLQDRVSWAGFVSEEKRAWFYRNADIFVLPSLDEGYGIVLMEAMSYSLPIIASRVGSIPELVVDGETGLLVPVGDVERLAAAISRLATAPQERLRLGQRGYQRSQMLARTWMQVGVELVETLVGLGT